MSRNRCQINNVYTLSSVTFNLQDIRVKGWTSISEHSNWICSLVGTVWNRFIHI